MIKLNVGDKWEVNIKNESKELNLQDVQGLINIETKNLTYIQRVKETFKLLADSDKYMYVENESLFDIFSKVKEFEDYKEGEYKKEVFVDGSKYILNLDKNGNPSINFKVMELVEKYIKDKPNDWVKYAVALLYREEDSDLIYHFKDKNIKKRVDILSKNLTGDIIFPLVIFISRRVTKSVFKLKDIFENGIKNEEK